MLNTMRIASFLDKGGVGKTTTVAHFGVALEEDGFDVLLIDLAGKQGDLAKHFGLWDEVQANEENWPNITTVFQDEWNIIAKQIDDAVDQLVLETGEGPDLIPAHEGLDGLDSMLGNIDDTQERYSRLDTFLTEFIDGHYDIVLLDLPGSTSNITYNGLWAAKNVLAPVKAGPFEEGQAAQLRDDLDEIREEQDTDIQLTMLILNELDERTNAGKHFKQTFTENYPDAIAPRQVNYSQDIVNAQIDGQTAFALEEPSKTAARALEAYRENATELVTRLEEQ
ncbi:ParA family protein [Haladaptatus sp. T7]|uniref:ParA family protein n=1 Tax=Haladaptatus sp. T7 TaxID=2029368 RepID=UPI0021A2544A|nr:ParA family protein [Haladaptatus sp. T7]GKZ16042.1 sporulation initiation inhibitor Soj [Haladaptatus sp. T7]